MPSTSWKRRGRVAKKILLREWFRDDGSSGIEKARVLVRNILDTGLESFNQPQLLPPIEPEAVELVCWMGLTNAPLSQPG